MTPKLGEKELRKENLGEEGRTRNPKEKLTWNCVPREASFFNVEREQKYPTVEC